MKRFGQSWILVAAFSAHAFGGPVVPLKPAPLHEQESPEARFAAGLGQTFHTWDLSLLGLGVLYKLNPSPAEFSPLGIDRSLTTPRHGADHNELAGSAIHPTSIQAWIICGQLGAVALLDALTGTEIDAGDYARPMVFAKTMLYTYGITEITKNWVNRMRPDGSDNRSFFSGHTSGSFAMSAFVYRELDDWIDGWEFARRSGFANSALKATAFAASYGWAAYVGYARMHDRKHYLSDVLVGAAVGTLLGNLIYDAHFGEAGEPEPSGLQFSFFSPHQPGFGVVWRF